MVRIVVEYSSESVQAPTFCRLGLISYSNAIGSIYPMGFTANDRLELAILSYTSQNSQEKSKSTLNLWLPPVRIIQSPDRRRPPCYTCFQSSHMRGSTPPQMMGFEEMMSGGDVDRMMKYRDEFILLGVELFFG